MTDRDIMQQALDALITCEVQIESEWGVARSMEQIEADGDTSPVILALRERLAQPEQEPVAWMFQCTADNSVPVLLREKQNWAESGTGLWVETPLYTSPPQRKPLTDEQVGEIYYGITHQRATISGSWIKTFARAIEAAHGIKEST